MCHGLTAFDGYQMANRKGRMEPGEARVWRWGRQKDGEVLCEPLWGNVMCKRCLFTHVYRCLDRVKYVCMYKVIFLPTGSLRHKPIAYHGLSYKWWISLWCISHLCVGLQPPSVPEEGETLQLQPWELGCWVGVLAWLTDLPCLHVSYIQCWISASERISCHTDTEYRDAAVLPGAGLERNRYWVSSYHL